MITETLPLTGPGAERSHRPNGLWAEAWRRLLRNPPAVVGLAVLAVFAFAAVFAPLLAPFDPNQQNYDAVFQGPSLSHLMGTDNLGRDWFSRLLYGARLSLTVGVFSQAIVVSIALAVGATSGYLGGRVDNLLMRFADLMYAFPDLLLIILLRSTFNDGVLKAVGIDVVGRDTEQIFTLFFIIGLVSWVSDARVVRGQVMALRGREFVEAAQALGATGMGVVRRHLLPNTWGPVIVLVTFGIPRAVFAEASLSFIGLGVGPGLASWGSMVQEGYGAIFAFPHLVLFPSIAIAMLMLAFTFVGDGLRDALDPRTRSATPAAAASAARRTPSRRAAPPEAESGHHRRAA